MRYDGTTGDFAGNWLDVSDLDGAYMTIGPASDLFIEDQDRIIRYDWRTGASLGTFATGGGLTNASGFVFGPDGDLYVADFDSDSVLKFDGVTGAPSGVFASGGGLSSPLDVTFGSGGDLFVGGRSGLDGFVFRYDGQSGAFLGSTDTGWPTVIDLDQGPDGNVYALTFDGFLPSGEVLRYDGETGAAMGSVTGFFVYPGGITFRADGSLLMSDPSNDRILEYDVTTDTLVGVFATGPELNHPGLLVFSNETCPYAEQVLASADPGVLNGSADVDMGTDNYPELATDGQGNWIAAWYTDDDLGGTVGTDQDILFARSADDGLTWSAPAALNSNAATDSGEDYLPRIATDANGNWVVVWYSNDDLGGTIGTDFDVLVSRSTDNGANWTPPAAIDNEATSDTGDDFWAYIAVDRFGFGGPDTWLVAWHSTDDRGGTIGTDRDVLFSRSNDGGATWGVPDILNSDAATDVAEDRSCRLDADKFGTWVAVWYSYGDPNSPLGADQDVLYSVSIDFGATWQPQTAIHSNADSDSGDDFDPGIAIDDLGNWVVAWESNEDLDGAIGTDLDILVLTSNYFSFQWSTPEPWGQPVPLNTNADSDVGDDGWPRIRSDGLGSWIGTWTSWDDLGGTIGTDHDVLYAISNDFGHTWSQPAPVAANATSDSGFDGITGIDTRGQGEWLVAWNSSEDLNGLIGPDGDLLFANILLPPAYLNDLAMLSACLTGPDGGPVAPDCSCIDFDMDGDVDLTDFAKLQIEIGS